MTEQLLKHITGQTDYLLCGSKVFEYFSERIPPNRRLCRTDLNNKGLMNIQHMLGGVCLALDLTLEPTEIKEVKRP